ncbi:MAG TPA: DUF362 domain-containing protein [Mobilitalea sp.]|nr:DUF362 domain-containing protein [Mobilitalea sp.]
MEMDMGKEITRRQFLGGVGIGLAALGLSGCGVDVKPNATEPTSGAVSNAVTSAAPAVTSGPVSSALVVAQGTEPASLIEKGLAALGGIGQFVKNGDVVVIKPNFSVPRRPEEAATTNPQLVAAVVKQCLSAGAKEVRVIDFPFSGPTCLNNSGIKDAVEEAGGTAYNINEESYFQNVEMGGQILNSILFSTDVLNADVFINMPILKNHMMARVTMSMKNMMGLVWDRGYFHSSDLNQAIAELSAYRKADLIIMDAIKGIIDRGPTGPGTIKEWDQVIFGFDPVAVDAYGANLYGIDPNEIAYITAAAKLGVGEMDLSKITVQNVTA